MTVNYIFPGLNLAKLRTLYDYFYGVFYFLLSIFHNFCISEIEKKDEFLEMVGITSSERLALLYGCVTTPVPLGVAAQY